MRKGIFGKVLRQYTDAVAAHVDTHLEQTDRYRLTVDANGNDTVFHGGAKSPDRIYAANFEGCSQIDIRNVSLINASYWTLRISDCDHVQIRGITIRSTSYFNNDGIDLDGRNITVSDCIIDCIDDAICLKSYYKERPC